MKVTDFITLEQARRILDDLRVFKGGKDNQFDSHEFIKLYQIAFNASYHDMYIVASSRSCSFWEVDKQIGRFLLNNHEELHINKVGKRKRKSLNSFGYLSPCQLWEFV